MAALTNGKQPRDAHVVETALAHWKEWWPGDCALVLTGEEMLFQCTACGAKYSDVEGYNYCPRCGTKVDGGAEL